MTYPLKRTYATLSSSSSSSSSNRRPYKKKKIYIAKPLPVYTNRERKLFDTVNAGTNFAAAGVILNNSLNLVTQGNAENQMIGRKITIRSIEVRGQLYLAGDSDATFVNNSTTNYRMCLVLDRQANGAAAAIVNIFDQATSYGFRNAENEKRFKILKEWNGEFNSQSLVNAASSGYNSDPRIKYIKWYKKCMIPIEFAPEATPGTRAITEVRSNNLLLLGFATAGDSLSWLGNVRIKFDDN